MANDPCVICNTVLNYVTVRSTNHLDCPRCGRFSITYEACINWKRSSPTERQRANASGWIRAHQEAELTTYNIDGLLTVPTPGFSERVDMLLRAIEKWSPSLGDKVNITKNIPQLMSESWSANRNEFGFLLYDYLINEAHLLALYPFTPDEEDVVTITPAGFSRLDSLHAVKTASQIGFCAMWFDSSVKPVWTQAIEPAILSAGYEPIRIDGHQHNNRIDDEIIALIRRSKFVVADFTAGTEPRGGVYFEAGYALGHGLPVIWTVRKDYLEKGKIHFDNRQYNFLQWEEGDLEGFKVALKNRIEATLGSGTYKQGS